MLAPGTQAPDFELKRLEGGKTSLEEILARGPAVVGFFKVSCPVCHRTWPYLERIHRGGRAAGLQVVGVSQDGAAETAAYNRELGISFPTLLDDPGAYAASNAFGIQSVPSLFVVEADGRISAAQAGFSKAALEALGRRVNVTVFGPADRVPEYQPG